MDTARKRLVGMAWLTDFACDVSYAFRTLRKSPGFAIVAILTLAVGIGAATAIYSVADTILLQPLPFADSDRLVRVVENIPATAGRPARQGWLITYQEFLEWRARTTALADAYAFTTVEQRLVRSSNGTWPLWGGMTTTNTFTMLGTRALLGRTIDPNDSENPNVALISFDAWRRLFQSNPNVVGMTMEVRAPERMFQNAASLVEPRLLTVIGVLPQNFEFPTFPTGPVDFYTPIVVDQSKRSPAVTMIGKLRPGVSVQAASDEANVVGSAVRPLRPGSTATLTGPRFEVQSLKDRIVRELRPMLRMLLGAVVVLLMIVCANVANLLLARGTARRREMAVRIAIGAGRGRVVRQVLTECLVLAVCGGVLGAVFGGAGVSLIKQLASVEAPGIFRVVFDPFILPRGNEIGVDLKVFVVAFGIATIASVAFGVLPALNLSQTNSIQAIALRGAGTGREETRTRAALVIGQLAMATVLLVGAGLLIHSFIKLSAVEKGYDPSNVLTFRLVVPADYSIARKAGAIEALLSELRAAPDVVSAGFTRAGLLLPEEIFLGTFVPPGRTLEEMRGDPVQPRLQPVSHGYLATIGARLREGREFQATDAATATPVIVISTSLARRYFGSGSAVGQIVDWYVGGGPAVQMKVIGVVDDLHNESPDRDAYPQIFVDYRQLLSSEQRWGHSELQQDQIALGFLSFAVRVKGNVMSAIPAVEQIARSVDPNGGVDAMIPIEKLVTSATARQRFNAVLLGLFAGVAGFLAAIGVYGMLAYAVIQRTQEIGIRMALGAQRADVLLQVLRRGLILGSIGITLGLVGAAFSARFLQGMLFGITELDMKTFVVVATLFGLVTMFASYLPARRATKVDPIVALRAE